MFGFCLISKEGRFIVDVRKSDPRARRRPGGGESRQSQPVERAAGRRVFVGERDFSGSVRGDGGDGLPIVQPAGTALDNVAPAGDALEGKADLSAGKGG